MTARKRVVITIDPGLWAYLKVRAKERDRSVSGAVEDAIYEYLISRAPPGTMEQVTRMFSYIGYRR